MTWNNLGTFTLTEQWQYTSVVTSNLLRISHFVNQNNGTIRGVIAQVLGENSFFDLRRLTYRTEKEIFLILNPEGLNFRKIAFKKNAGIQASWQITVEELTDVSSVNLPVNLQDIIGLQDALDAKALLNHQHQVSSIDGLQDALDAKALANHQHQVSGIDGLQEALDTKALVNHQHQVSGIDGLQEELDTKALVNHQHQVSGIDGLQEALDTKALVNHQHQVSGIDGLQEALDTKAIKSTSWQNIAFQNGWTNFGQSNATGQYRKVTDSLIEVKGILSKSSAFVGGEVIGVLPVGYRPPETLPFSTASRNRDCRITVSSNGEIRIIAGVNTEISIACMFSI
jgi:Phage tail repeat like